jgi:hypothetical protein
MLKIYCYFSLLVFSIISAPATAQKEANSLHRCNGRSEKTEVIITTHQNGFEIINRLSSRALNTKSKSSYAGDYVVGLTSLESITQIDFDGPVWPDDETGGECFAPRIEISLHYAPLQVFIGNEFKPGTCSYGVILDHEKQHVRLYQENLPRVENILRSLMEKRFANKPLYAPSGKSKQMLENEIDTLWRPLIKIEFAKIQIEQNQLDSDESLAVVSWSCLGEVQKILGFRY